VIAHELIGHGLQFLRRRHGSMRELKRKCEARLFQERVNQDVGLNKLSRTSVAAQKIMEDKYCAGFKRFMKRKSPSLMGLWDHINPDVPQLLALFEPYLAELARDGTTRMAVDAGKQSRGKFLRSAATDGDATAQYQLGMLYARGKILTKNQQTAANWIEKVAKQSHAKAQNRIGVIHEFGHGRPKDDLQAIHWYRKAAERNLPEAETNCWNGAAAWRATPPKPGSGCDAPPARTTPRPKPVSHMPIKPAEARPATALLRLNGMAGRRNGAMWPRNIYWPGSMTRAMASRVIRAKRISGTAWP